MERTTPPGEITKEKVAERWAAWDAHAAHGDTYAPAYRNLPDVYPKSLARTWSHDGPSSYRRHRRPSYSTRKRLKEQKKATAQAATPEHHEGTDAPW